MTKAATAAGITKTPISGTDSRFATKPYCAIVLKWAAPMGAVKPPATAEEITVATAGASHFGPSETSALRNQPKIATNPVVAAKDIWNPGPVNASGRRTNTIVAAIATTRRVSARRPMINAPRATATMMNARSVATFPPDNSR